MWPNFATFCHKAREAFENFEKSTSVSAFFSNFAIFRPHFHQLFATRRVKPWKFWKNSWLPAEIELLPVEIPRKLVIFWKPETEIGFFWHFRWKIQLPFPVFSIFAIFGPHFHQLFAKILRWSLENLDLKTGNGNRPTSGEFLSLPVKKSTSVSCFHHFCHFRTPISPTFCQNTKVY